MSVENIIDENEWVEIPAGGFMMGSPDDEPGHEEDEGEHPVKLEGFAMMRHTVTFKQYDEYCALQNLEKKEDSGWGRGQRPVLFVQWLEAKAFAKWLTDITGYTHRLPTEAEWEYAARAGTSTKYSWGNTIDCTKARYGYYSGDCSKQESTDRVKSFSPNPWGLYDMHGNVWEWTQDCWNNTYNGVPTNGSAWTNDNCDRRGLRGGAWYGNADLLRSALRNGDYRSQRRSNYGFRLVLSP